MQCILLLEFRKNVGDGWFCMWAHFCRGKCCIIFYPELVQITSNNLKSLGKFGMLMTFVKFCKLQKKHSSCFLVHRHNRAVGFALLSFRVRLPAHFSKRQKCAGNLMDFCHLCREILHRQFANVSDLTEETGVMFTKWHAALLSYVHSDVVENVSNSWAHSESQSCLHEANI